MRRPEHLKKKINIAVTLYTHCVRQSKLLQVMLPEVTLKQEETPRSFICCLHPGESSLFYLFIPLIYRPSTAMAAGCLFTSRRT